MVCPPPPFCFLPPFHERRACALGPRGAPPPSCCAQPLSWCSDWHVGGMRMWALWLHPWVTTNPARAFLWLGTGRRVRGWPAEPCTHLAEEAREAGALRPAPLPGVLDPGSSGPGSRHCSVVGGGRLCVPWPVLGGAARQGPPSREPLLPLHVSQRLRGGEQGSEGAPCGQRAFAASAGTRGPLHRVLGVVGLRPQHL